MSLPKKLYIRECVSRDGWQILPGTIPTETKIMICKKLIDNGVRNMDFVSFVRPDIMPQMADAEIVAEGVREYAAAHGVRLTCMAPGKKGEERAASCGMTSLMFGFNLSEEHNKRNVNRTLEQSFAEGKQMIEHFKSIPNSHLHVGLGCVFGSPFDEEIKDDDIRRLCHYLMEWGVDDVGLPDTAGVSDPAHTGHILRVVKEIIPAEYLTCHFHDTKGFGIANAYVALEEGISHLDCCLGGLGGCPAVPGDRGNIPTEDVLQLARDLGIECDLDFEKTVELALEMEELIGCNLCSAATAYAKATRGGCKN